MRYGLSGGSLIGIQRIIRFATGFTIGLVLTWSALPDPVQSLPKPERTSLNLNNLIPESYREEYQRKILDVSKQALVQKAAEEKAAAEREAQHQRQLEQQAAAAKELAVAPEVQVAQVSGDCYTAMRATWPQHLWAGATIVMQKESGARSHATGTINPDGSQDFGCFQINNKAHRGFFANHDWSDPYQNAAYGYQIYQGRQSYSAWYAVKGILW